MITLKNISLAGLLLVSLTACDGDDGKDGATGSTGLTGEQGTQGEQGVAGEDGKNATNSLTTSLVARAVLNVESPEGAAEIVQYQQSTGWIYAINSSGEKATVDVLDLNNIDPAALTKDSEGVVTNTNMTSVMQLDLSVNTAGDANSVAISNTLNMMAVAMAAEETGDLGFIAFYDISGATPSFIKNVQVGHLPDMVTFSKDGTKVVVANEGEPSGDYTIDPEGSISIIDINDGVISDTAINLDFTAFNDKKAELISQGVMFANPSGRTISGQLINTTVAMDLEPEYVAISSDSQTAFVSIQENNAIAIVNLATNTLEEVKGLGFKDWSNYQIDASDKDGGINFKTYQNLYGMYQPDTIATFTWQDANFIISANEGDGREYFFDASSEADCTAKGGLDYDEDDGCLAYIDESRVEDLPLDPIAFSQVNNDDDDIGRLKVSMVKGDIDGDGDYDQLYTYGARSFSIWDQNGNIVFDSGDDVGKITAAIHGQAFNNDEDTNEGDTRSDAKGAEPEALTIGKIGENTYAFIGLERMSGIMIYDITNPFNVSFVDYFINRGTTEEAEITGDLAPEGMSFIPATATSNAMLIVGNEISGSVSVWEISQP
ncbi:choice-of-anchor I family protein [Thalassotalea castellviae]|uniref:Choice-of-anchor I family protein n=1 Tax=Thalassotalea castellviae TaxID=3075612 RepID=A0ABU3A5F7_9GAMM|nr:choice-of-anchor I family protein [Thalassotalea sp. W431]MDT0605118.1 choice-of-anchor I family protein [Thalassotalea sp. W431]